MESRDVESLSHDVLDETTTNAEQAATSDVAFPVVGVGASAGGLESLEELFSRMPQDSGIAFVVVQHLSPDFDSVMDQLLSRRTEISIRQAEDGLQLSPDHIFLIPPKKVAIVSNGRFRLRDKQPSEKLSVPIDNFFRSLAQDIGPRAIAVILSGSGNDGSRGIIDIHSAGGQVIVESRATAKFHSMPVSAHETGVVDFVLDNHQIARHILAYVAEHFPLERKIAADSDQQGVGLVLRLLNQKYGIDVSHYEPKSIGRRIERRMTRLEIHSIEAYAECLGTRPEELNLMYQELLIGETQFFRDPEAFEQFREEVIPQLIEDSSPGGELRIWTAGCATGEEVYSIAILLHEYMEFNGLTKQVKIFATDVHQSSLDQAAAGLFVKDSLENVSAERMARYFREFGDGYIIDPDVRRMIVFASHNVIQDAPFTKLDLVVCRNLLIYFEPQTQKKVLSLFHFGLNSGGVLWLGPSESPGDLEDEFETLQEQWKLYRKRRSVRLQTEFCNAFTRENTVSAIPPAIPKRQLARPDDTLVGAYDWLLSRFMPPAVLISERYELLHVFGGAERFLRIKSGRPTLDALDHFDGDLRTVVAAAIHRVSQSGDSIRYTGVPVHTDDQVKLHRITVEVVCNRRTEDRQFLVTFEVQQSDGHVDNRVHLPSLTESTTAQVSVDRIAALEDELRFAKENLQAAVEELETSNEELRAANEELVSSNEELQSTNEELHSVNQELYTVNAEYQRKIDDLTQMTADFDNLMESTDVATVFLDENIRIRKFTPQIATVFDLMPQDIGRRIDVFANHIEEVDLLSAINDVLATGEPAEFEMCNRAGRWQSLRILPYRSDQLAAGVVLTVVDIDKLKRTQERLAQAVADREEFLAMLSHEMRNPINAVLNASRLLDARDFNANDLDRAVSVIHRQSSHLTRLLDDLLDVSRMTHSKLDLRMQPIELHEVIDSAIETVQPTLAAHEQTLHLQITEMDLPITGDPDRLRQVLVNLLANASKYSPDGSDIEMSSDIQGDAVITQVVDHGHGIAAKMLENVFNPFIQSERVHQHSEGGMGVGLALVQYVVENHQGSVDLQSEGEGKGTQVTVTLPLDRRADRENVLAAPVHDDQFANAAKRVGGGIQRVAIVEDDRDNREMLQALLEMEGFEVVTATDGEEGIAKIIESESQVALIDIGLPSKSGFEVASEVRRQLDFDIFLIALTGHGKEEDIEATKKAGFDEHLVKPLEMDKLMRLLKPMAQRGLRKQ